VDGRGVVEERLHYAPTLLDPVLAREALAVSDERRMEEDLIGGWTLPALRGEVHV
jgi:hypothetical protein